MLTYLWLLITKLWYFLLQPEKVSEETLGLIPAAQLQLNCTSFCSCPSVPDIEMNILGLLIFWFSWPDFSGDNLHLHSLQSCIHLNFPNTKIHLGVLNTPWMKCSFYTCLNLYFRENVQLNGHWCVIFHLLFELSILFLMIFLWGPSQAFQGMKQLQIQFP